MENTGMRTTQQVCMSSSSSVTACQGQAGSGEEAVPSQPPPPWLRRMPRHALRLGGMDLCEEHE